MMKDTKKVEIPMSVVFDHFPEIKKVAESFNRNFEVDFLFGVNVSTAYISTFGTLLEWAVAKQTVLFVDEVKVIEEIEDLKQLRDNLINDIAKPKKDREEGDIRQNKNYIKHSNRLIDFWERQLVLHKKRMEESAPILGDPEEHAHVARS